MEKDEVLDFLKRLAESIAVMFGDCCETLVHDMSVPGHPILAIYNGKVSGREIGSTQDIYGNKPGAGYFNETIVKRDFVNMQVVTMDGKKVKSTTIHFRGRNYSYALGINYDYTQMQKMHALIDNFIQVNQDLYREIADSENTTLEDIVADCVNRLGIPIEEMTKRERLQAISMMKERNVFHFQKAVPYVSECLGVSRYTVYKYISEV